MQSGSRAQLSAFRADLQKYYRLHFGTASPSLRDRASLWATHMGLHCVAGYRLARLARALAAAHAPVRIPLVNVARAVELAMEVVHHVRIGAEVGPGFYVGHAGMIFIGPTRIGANFSVTHGVTIGVGQGEQRRGTPIVGDDVWVGTGAVLAGAIEVGDGATIASGAMVTRSVPPRALAGGNPARVILAGYDNSALLGGEPPQGGRWRPAAVDELRASGQVVAARADPSPQPVEGGGEARAVTGFRTSRRRWP